MASNASLTGFRQKLVTCIDDLRTRREALNESIREDEMQKIEIENKLPRLSMELSRSNDKIERLDKSNQEIESAIQNIEECNKRVPLQSVAWASGGGQIKEAKERYKGVCEKERKYHEDRKAKGL